MLHPQIRRDPAEPRDALELLAERRFVFPVQVLLDLEREAFLSLCGERKTQERIAYTLKTGKPLRN